MERTRWLFVTLGLGMVAIIAAATVANTGLNSLPVLLVFSGTCAIFLLWRSAPALVAVLLFAVMSALVVVFHGFVSTTPLALFLLATLATWRAPRRWIALVLGVATIAHVIVQLALEQDTILTGIATAVGVMFLYSIGGLLVSERVQRERVARLLREVEQHRAMEETASLAAERGRMARELHDVLAHTLSGLAIQLESARILAGEPTVPAELRETVERAHRLSRAGLQEARRAVAALRGDQLPGPELLPLLVEEHRLSANGAVQFAASGTPRALDAEANLAIYRTAQEALSNVRKHAPGAAVSLSLQWLDTEVVLTVQDDGGNSVTQVEHDTSGLAGVHQPGYGLTGMAERAELLGAKLATGPQDAGFQVRLSVPLESVGKDE
jgi:signal transduction histidine kinase